MYYTSDDHRTMYKSLLEKYAVPEGGWSIAAVCYLATATPKCRMYIDDLVKVDFGFPYPDLQGLEKADFTSGDVALIRLAYLLYLDAPPYSEDANSYSPCSLLGCLDSSLFRVAQQAMQMMYGDHIIS